MVRHLLIELGGCTSAVQSVPSKSLTHSLPMNSNADCPLLPLPNGWVAARQNVRSLDIRTLPEQRLSKPDPCFRQCRDDVLVRLPCRGQRRALPARCPRTSTTVGDTCAEAPPAEMGALEGADDVMMGDILVDSVLDVLAPNSTRLAGILASSSLTAAQKRALMSKAYLQACSSGALDLLEWLLSTNSLHQPVLQDATGSSGGGKRTGTWFDVDAVDEEGSPALVLATVFGHSDAARLLIEAGVDKDARDGRGWTALMWAFQIGSELCSRNIVLFGVG